METAWVKHPGGCEEDREWRGNREVSGKTRYCQGKDQFGKSVCVKVTLFRQMLLVLISKVSDRIVGWGGGIQGTKDKEMHWEAI